MNFVWPLVLLALLLVPLALVCYLLVQRRRARYTVRFTNLDVLASVAGGSAAWRRWVPVSLYLLALAAMVVGLARPQANIAVPKEQATVVLVMDVSGSMNATDVEPSRIQAARRSAKTFIEALPDTFPIGIVAFDESASILTRPTIDRPHANEIIDSLAADGGTAMGDGINQALDLRPGGPNAAPPPASDKDPDTIVLLLSDGASTTGTHPLAAADHARELRVPVYTIALGTPEGTLNPFGGRRIPVPPDEATLQAIAERTGGRFFTAPTDEELRSIYKELSSRIGFVNEKQEVTVLFAAAALLLLVAGATISVLWTGRLP
jgi:Ca-activated chloride channel family protein